MTRRRPSRRSTRRPGLISSGCTAHESALRWPDTCASAATSRSASRRRCPSSGAQVVEAVRNEMALTLEDVVLRRTGLGSAGYPGDEAVLKLESILRDELGWTSARVGRRGAVAEGVLPAGARHLNACSTSVMPAMTPKSGDRSVKPNSTPPSNRSRPRRVAHARADFSEWLGAQAAGRSRTTPPGP